MLEPAAADVAGRLRVMVMLIDAAIADRWGVIAADAKFEVEMSIPGE